VATNGQQLSGATAIGMLKSGRNLKFQQGHAL
jgi:hypothetical protein